MNLLSVLTYEFPFFPVGYNPLLSLFILMFKLLSFFKSFSVMCAFKDTCPRHSRMCIYFALCCLLFHLSQELHKFSLSSFLKFSFLHKSELYLLSLFSSFSYCFCYYPWTLRDLSFLPTIEGKCENPELKTVMLVHKIKHLWAFIHHIFSFSTFRLSAGLGVYFGYFSIMHFLSTFYIHS